ncbi:MAG: acireductone synthase [Halothiobacillaceae bacterium]|jgi:enolase-phosphatase E1|nr:MAG: acireductone synthase [Halothiobacillaceae bacterium]
MIKAIVTDIEGTTSSIDFVHKVLFPYARERIADFVRQRAGEPAVQEQIEAVGREVGDDHIPLEEAIHYLVEWIDEDRKITPLKALQGMLWEEGYRNGDFTGHMYPDAVEWLRRWHAQGLRLYVYSSGSVQAQELLFRHSDAGDLTPLFAGHFDTTIGAKREADAYRVIAEALELPPAEILFLSDMPAELDAARAAGMQVLGLARHGEPMSTQAAAHRWCRDFAEVAQVMRAAG